MIDRVIRDFLTATYGESTEITPMYGLSHNRIWRVSFGESYVVVKALADSTEAAFYQQVAPVLTGVPTPELKTSARVDNVDWLVLEYIPERLPRSRWLADPRCDDRPQ